MAFGFGLIHGLGLSNVLRNLGLSGRQLFPALLGFNLGRGDRAARDRRPDVPSHPAPPQARIGLRALSYVLVHRGGPCLGLLVRGAHPRGVFYLAARVRHVRPRIWQGSFHFAEPSRRDGAAGMWGALHRPSISRYVAVLAAPAVLLAFQCGTAGNGSGNDGSSSGGTSVGGASSGEGSVVRGRPDHPEAACRRAAPDTSGSGLSSSGGSSSSSGGSSGG